MENSAKRIKLEMSQESAVSVDEEKSVFDEIPDEVLEMIIKYVPCKKACFLVNKRFNKEASNATRNCRLVLDEHSIKDAKLNQIQREFKELSLDFRNCYIDKYNERITRLAHMPNILKIINRSGLQIKKFVMKFKGIHESNVLMLLSLLTHLEELDLDARDIVSSKADIVNIPHLKSLSLSMGSEVTGDKLLELLNCPALEKLVLHNTNGTVNALAFIRRHQHLKHLIIHRITAENIQNILSIDGLNLTTLDISKSWHNKFVLGAWLINQKELKTLKLPMNRYIIDNEGLCSIIKLSKLETLSLYLGQRHDEPCSEVLFGEILKLKQLKSLIVGSDNVEVIKPLSTVENLRLEELTLQLPYFDGYLTAQRQTMQETTLQSFFENLPNLKKLSLSGFDYQIIFNTLSRLQHLESFKFTEEYQQWHIRMYTEELNVSEANFKIYQLELQCECIKFINACVKMMPNVKNLTLLNSFDDFSIYLKFSNLEELHASSEYLLQANVIAVTKEQGQQLKKIIATSARNQAKEFVRHYGREFPIQKMNSETEELTLMRA